MGVATAYQLLGRFPDLSVHLFEKEERLAAHQTGRNSGVIHSGIYYPPGSLKASLCLRGKSMLEQFCSQQQLPWEKCGKVIVATCESELPQLDKLFCRGQEHGLAVQSLNPEQLREIEPHCRGLSAILVPETGIVGYRAVTERLAALSSAQGLHLHLNHRLQSAQRRGRRWRLHFDKDSVETEFWINCAGLYSDKVVGQAGSSVMAAIVPFRGEYYSLRESAKGLCQNLIYPVPDPRFPFLGVHFTRGVDGSVEAGPNAVLALGRENYSKWAINLGESLETLTYEGFLRLALKYWRVGAEEMLRSFSKRLFHKALQTLVPDLALEDLAPGGAGIRAQAVRPDGALVDDFFIHQDDRVVHVINAPSPAATSSLAIAEYLVDLAQDQFDRL